LGLGLGLESGFGGAETGVEVFEFGFLSLEGLLPVWRLEWEA